jgi:pimeloyl-ACP methyl ester carboxylesterase
MRQRVERLVTPDHVSIAWAEAGRGPTLVKPSNWLTHLEYDWDSPVWRHWIAFLAAHSRRARYDERGCGMTSREVADVSADRWLGDLEAVVAAAGCRRGLGVTRAATIHRTLLG